jgi:flagellin-like hook-associated protein FlgL
MNTSYAQGMVVSNINRQSVVLNKMTKLVSHGKKSVNPNDDAGSLSAVARNKQTLANLEHTRRNIQNNLSFLQTQDSAMVKVGDIIQRCTEIKTSYLSPLLTDSEKDMYNEEFRSLQLELREMKSLKYNGVSLFALESDPTLIERAEDPNDLNGYNKEGGGVIRIERTGIFDDLTGTSSIPVEAGSSNAAGGPNEYREPIQLKNYSGKLTFWQWPIGVPDNFRVYHGSTMIHDETYGNFGSSKTLNDGRTITPASHTPANNGEYNNNKDIIPFGQSGNRSMTLELVMNESGFVPPATTGWSMAYEIEYDPIAIDLSTPDTIWTLDDFSLDDFERFLDVVSSARAQNGASQKEIENLSQQYENALVGLQEYSSNMDDVDIAKSVADIKKSEVNLALNYHFIDQVAKIDTLLIDDFLT